MSHCGGVYVQNMQNKGEYLPTAMENGALASHSPLTLWCIRCLFQHFLDLSVGSAFYLTSWAISFPYSVQNAAACLVHNVPKISHVTPPLRPPHCLHLIHNQIRSFGFACRALNGTTPVHLPLGFDLHLYILALRWSYVLFRNRPPRPSSLLNTVP